MILLRQSDLIVALYCWLKVARISGDSSAIVIYKNVSQLS
jgi:hypothetical protein